MENNTKSLFKNKLTTKLISLFLTLLIIFFAVPSIIYAEAAEAIMGLGSEEAASFLSDNDTSLSNAGIYEVEELREENVKHFRLEDGSYVAAQYPLAVHISDGEGGWKDINNSLVPLFNEITSADGRIKISKKTTGNGKLFTLHSEDKKITFSLVGANKGIKGEVTNYSDAEDATELQKMMNLEKLSSSVIYRDILSGVDIEYVLNGLGIKENIIIKEKADAYSYTFELELNGLEAVLVENGSIELTDESGNTEYLIPAPIIFDAAGEYGSAEYTLTEENASGKYLLTVTADSEWVNAENRAFPVTLDPAICPSTSDTVDIHVNSTIPTNNYANSTYLYVYSNGTAYWKTSNLNFIPQNAYISNATLFLCTESTSYGYIGAHLVTSAWDRTLTYAQTQASTPAGAISDKMLSYTYVDGEANIYFGFDITEAVRYWNENPTANYGVALKYIKGGRSYFYSSVNGNAAPRPCLAVSYVDLSGIESYNSYSSHSVGGVANGHVNLATGNLVMDIPLLTATNAVMPYTLSLVHDTAREGKRFVYTSANVPFSSIIAPFTFKWSMQQSVVKRSYTNESGETKNLYIWSDADGSEHSFFESGTSGVYIDNDGLGLKLSDLSSTVTITSKDKTVYTFSSISFSSNSGFTAAWYLSSISDSNLNKIIFNYDSTNLKPLSIKFAPNGSTGAEIFRFAYSSSSMTVPCAVYDVLTGKGVVLSYSNTYSGSTGASYYSYLRDVKYVTGSSSWNDSSWASFVSGDVISHLTLYYNSSRYLNSVYENISSSRIRYTYSGAKVATVTENISSVNGQKIGFTYGTGYTDVRASGTDDTYGNGDDIITRYIFDSRGRAISVYARNADGTRIYNGIVGSYENEEKIKNNVKEVIDIGEGKVNLLVNGGFETDSGLAGWNYTSGVVLRTSQSLDGTRYLEFPASANSYDSISQLVKLTSGVNTISLDLSSAFAIDITVGVKISGAFDSAEVARFEFAKNERLNDYTNGYDVKRVSESFSISSEAYYKVEIFVSGDSGAGSSSVYIDNVMLTDGADMASYNMVVLGGCESTAVSLSSTYFWDYDTSYVTYASSTSAGSLKGSSFKVTTTSVNDAPVLTQRIFESSSGAQFTAENEYLVSAYGKSADAVAGGEAVFAIRIDVGYFNGYDSNNAVIADVETFYFHFLPNCPDWQFISGIFTTESYRRIVYIDLTCDFSAQPGGVAYFDNISVTDANEYRKVEYDYYPNTGNVKTKTGFNEIEYYKYDADDRLVLKANTDGELYEYTYDANNNLKTERYYSYYRTGVGNTGYTTYPIDDANPDSLITKTPIMLTQYTYDSYGLNTAVNITGYKNGTAQSKKISSWYTYDTNTSSPAFFGALQSETDSLGRTVRYFMDITDTGIVSAAVNTSTRTGTAVFTDIWGNVESVLPVTNLSGDSYTYETDTESVDYTYNAKNQLSSIITDKTTYTLTYDSYGNQSIIKAGSNTLASYEYNSGNGKLKSVTYGNGFKIRYVYNELENISEIWYTVSGSEVLAYEYSYTEAGYLHSITDVRSGKCTVYNYDKNGRLILATEYNSSDMSNDLSARSKYDDYGNLQSITYMLTYRTSSSYVDDSLQYSYSYDMQSRLSGETLYLNSVGATTSYTYDRFQRVSNISFNYIGSFTSSIIYFFSEDETNTSTEVDAYRSTINGTSTEYSYNYDSRGNITEVFVNGIIQYVYEYDNLSQLVREDNIPKNKTYLYVYDNSGNLTLRRTYALTSSAVPSGSYTEDVYTYSTGTWGDLLTAYKGTSITYDAIGNPLSYYGSRVFTWEGRRLKGATNGSVTMSFTYNDEGIRTSKTVNGVTTNYYLNGTQIIAEETNGNISV